ncbi:hypothetical protein ACFSTC_09930 [Nonomuraea ferruginea]
MTGDKLIGLPEAVTAHVQPGRTVYLGNFGAQLFAVGHEIIRQGRTGLHVVIGSGGILLDQLLGGRARWPRPPSVTAGVLSVPAPRGTSGAPPRAATGR